MKEFHMPLDYVLNELPMAQGWALIAWSTENNGWVEMARKGPGYIGQEALKNG